MPSELAPFFETGIKFANGLTFRRRRSIARCALVRVGQWALDSRATIPSVADKIAVMNEGTLQQLGTPSEIYDLPANNFVARFVGSTPMNFVPGALQKENGHTVHRSDQFVIPVSAELADRAAELCPSGKCTLGVRPEEIRFTVNDDGGNQARVFLLEPLGSETILDIEKEGLLLKVKDVAATQVREGDTLSLSFNRFHLFDDATGEAIR